MKKFYFKRRLVSSIEGPVTLDEILAFKDNFNIQICNFKDVYWTWVSDHVAYSDG